MHGTFHGMKAFTTGLSVSGIVLAWIVAVPLTHAADPASAAKPYPLSTCIVSDEKLGEMGKPVMVDYKGQQVGFCCKSCLGDFDKEPAKYLAKLQATAKP
jgi:YHS domain-containing protein